MKIYQSIKPRTPVEHRNRCMLGFVVFQGFMRSELTELRESDIDYERSEVFIQGQSRTNSRRLKLEFIQMQHLYDYQHKYRADFLGRGMSTNTDRFFLSRGKGEDLNNSVTRLLRKLRWEFPQVQDLRHLRGSVITKWQDEEGLMEAMVKAGHRYVSSTERYRTTRYEELQDQLKSLHPLEKMQF
ncbi:MAG: site-specific integrase [Bacteroidia bacterium]|nr:site-specific integrase [Bacteroidia bacterium]